MTPKSVALGNHQALSQMDVQQRIADDIAFERAMMQDAQMYSSITEQHEMQAAIERLYMTGRRV